VTALLRSGEDLSSGARGAGKNREKTVVPVPASLLAFTDPRCASMIERTIARPSPVPPLLRVREASTR
jgi:hypothetical protein